MAFKISEQLYLGNGNDVLVVSDELVDYVFAHGTTV